MSYMKTSSHARTKQPEPTTTKVPIADSTQKLIDSLDPAIRSVIERVAKSSSSSTTGNTGAKKPTNPDML